MFKTYHNGNHMSFIPPKPCDTGTYNPNFNSEDGSACLSCESGLYCPDVATIQAPSRVCEDGFDCEFGQNNQEAQIPCDKGKECKNGIPSDCPDGEYNPNFGQSECLPCENGYLCDNKTRMTPCPDNYYCSQGVQTICPNGTYRDIEFGASEDDLSLIHI